MKLAEKMKNKSIENADNNVSESYHEVIKKIEEVSLTGMTKLHHYGELSYADITVLKYIDGFKIENGHSNISSNGITYVHKYYSISWE